MFFFNKVKQFLGVGTLDVSVQVPPHFRPTDPAISGQLLLTARSDQAVLSIRVELEEKFETGRGEDKKTRRFTLGRLRLGEAFTLQTGESRTVDFTVPFQLLQSSNDRLRGQGGVLGTVGKMGAWAADERSAYALTAVVDVKGATLDPTATVDLKLVA